jgi:translation initiation factor IF-2
VSKRVFQLAKELGVKSTAIVDKCKAEGLTIKNHMSTLSAGLEATIREWFSEHTEGETSLTVETTAPVDLEKVKAKKTRKRKVKAKVEKARVSPESAVHEGAVPGVVKEAGEEAGAAIAVAEPPMGVLGKDEAGGTILTELPVETPAEEASAVGGDIQVIDLTEAPVRDEPKSAVRGKRPTKPKRKSPKDLATEKQAKKVRKKKKEAEPAVDTSAVPAAAAPLRMAPGFESTEDKEKDRIKKIDHVPAPAKLMGPQVIRVEEPEKTRKPPSRPSRVTLRDLMPPMEAGALELGSSKIKTSGKRGRRRSVLGDEERGEQEGPRPKSRTSRRSGRGHELSALQEPHEWGDRDWQERQERLAQAAAGRLSGRARRLARDDERAVSRAVKEPTKIEKATIKEPIFIKDLSAAIGVRANEIIAKLMTMGVMTTITQSLEAETAQMVALEFGVELEVEEKKLLLDDLQEEFDREYPDEEQEFRPPVVAFLGHVDHGKTSLLDKIRKASVATGEAGGITQHIGSYLYDDGKRRVTFLDTPGHKAFTAMRARGANMTDIVVLVVAADDGVMPQTEEAISHAQAAGVPIVVALNKIDLPGVDENKILGQLAEKGLVSAAWGGETEVVRTSALTGEGISDLIEHLDYVAELHHLKSKSSGAATGWVVEAEMTTGQGVVARLLVKQGTLKPGDVIVSGSTYGRIRTIVDASGNDVSEAGPSMPIEVTGLDEVPIAGDRFFAVADISGASEIADEQRNRKREKRLAQRRQVTLENLFTEIAAGELREFNVILKADVQGSVDVLRDSVTELNTSEVAVRVLHAAVGGITESDVLLAEASNAVIIGFQVVAEEAARHLAETKGVDIRLYRVIYNVTEEIRQALEGMLAPEIEEKQLGRVEVRDTFKVSRFGTIAGCYVTEGVIKRSSKVRLIRDNIVINDNMSIQSMRRVKEDITESRAGFECGIKLADFDDVKIGDVIEAYEMVEVSRKLEPMMEGAK